MTTRSEISRAVGQLLIGGFPGEEIHEEFEALVREERVGGAILFSRNLTTLEQTAELVGKLRALTSGVPLWVAIDQEGGRVQRLRSPFPELPPMRVFGDRAKKTLALRAGHLIGESLALFGINQNYAPVLDVDSNPNNPVIGARSFSRDPSAVARLGAAFIEGHQSAGVAACGKHFPGHGDTSEDSHLALPTLPHSQERLHEVELVPFRAAVRTEVAAIMTAHIVFPLLDAEHPATLSERVIETLLRKEIGYDGVIVSDDLEMKAIADHYGIEDAAVRAIRAGCDQLLICHQPSLVAAAHTALVEAVERGTLAASRVLEAAARVLRLKERYRARPDRPAPEEVVKHLPQKAHAELIGALEAPKLGSAQMANLSDRQREALAEIELEEGDPDERLELALPPKQRSS